MQQLDKSLLPGQSLERVLAEVARGKFQAPVEQRVRRVRKQDLPAVACVADA